MSSSIPFKKLNSTPKNVGQSSDKKSNKQKNERVSSMLQLLQINGKQVFDEANNKKVLSMRQKPEMGIEQFIEKQFQDMKARIKAFCQHQQAKFIQHSKLQKLVIEQQKGLYRSKIISESDIIWIYSERIRKFLKENNFQSIERVNTKKLEFISDNNEMFCRDSCIKEINGTVDEIEQKDKMETIQVNQCNIVNLKMRVNIKSTGEKFHSPNFINNLPISCSSTISQILYKQAQNKQFQQFHDFCQKILLQTKPVISDINILKNKQLEKTNSYLNEIYNKLHLLNTQLSNLASTGQVNPLKKEISFYETKKKNICEEIDYICGILKKINQIHNIDSIFLNCQRPCCQFERPSNSLHTKAKILINLKQSAKKSAHYKTQATDNYFNRYYHNDKFDMARIYSLTKTKTQEMQNLQKTYYRSKSKHCKKRSQSLYENF